MFHPYNKPPQKRNLTVCGGNIIKKEVKQTMETEIIVALIALLGSVLGTFSGIVVSSKLVNYRIEQLEKKVDKHNQVIDRVYKLEQHEAVVDEEIKVANHRIEDLEEFHSPTMQILRKVNKNED